MAIKRKTHPYYNFDKLLSYSAAWFFFLVGGRGLGKTFGAKKNAIKRFIKHGEQFIYLRRFKSELKARGTFFADIGEHFPDWDFQVKGHEAQISHVKYRGDDKRVWQTMGYFVALSTAQTQKGASYHNVTTILFDEFIIEKGLTRYLPDEADVFNNFYFTVDRSQSKTKVFFLANSVSIMNPYFLQYDIRPDEESEFVIKADGFIVCHFPDSANFQSSVFETAFGRFIQGTAYADYAVGNSFADNNDALLKMKDAKARAQYIIETKRGKFSVWYSNFENEYYIQQRLPGDAAVFTLDPEKMSEGKQIITFNDLPMQQLRTAWRSSRVFFDEQSTRNTFTEIFRR